MKKAIMMALAISLIGGMAHAQRAATVSCPNEPGSILVFPCIDNTAGKATIIEIANLSTSDVYVHGYMIVSDGSSDFWYIKDWIVHITAKEPFFWNTAVPYNRTNVKDYVNQIQGFGGYYGCMFVVAVQSRVNPLEIDHDFLKGDALCMNGVQAWQYNAIPHQAIAITPDRVLKLDGVEYTQQPYQVYAEGFAGDLLGPNSVSGYLCVTVLAGLDLIESEYPEADINVWAYNQNEVPQSRHLHYDCCEMYDLIDDLQLHIDQIFTPKWQASATANWPLYAVFTQSLGQQSWGGNTFQAPAAVFSGAKLADLKIVLDPIPLNP